MNIRKANERARSLFGPGAVCETRRTGQTYERVVILKDGLPGTPVGEAVLRFPGGTPWSHAFDMVTGLLAKTGSEGT